MVSYILYIINLLINLDVNIALLSSAANYVLLSDNICINRQLYSKYTT